MQSNFLDRTNLLILLFCIRQKEKDKHISVNVPFHNKKLFLIHLYSNKRFAFLTISLN